MAVITDVYTHPRVLGIKHWITKIPGGEVELLPEPGMAVRYVMFAVLAEVSAVGVDDRGRVEIHAWHVLFVDRNNNHHFMLRCDLLHELNGRPIRHALCQFVPASVLLRAKIRAIEKLLQTEDFRFLARRLIDQFQVFVDHRLPDLFERAIGAECIAGLNQSAADNARHGSSKSTVEKRTIAETTYPLIF